MKKIIPLILFSIFLIAGLVFYNVSKTNKIENYKKNFIVVKGSGESVYPFELTFPPNTQAREVVYEIYSGNKAVKDISIKIGGVWRHENLDYIIKKDLIIKVNTN